MCQNVGDMDRMLRIFAGLAIIGWGLAASSWFGLIGFVPLFTGITAYCPAYLPFKISTR